MPDETGAGRTADTAPSVRARPARTRRSRRREGAWPDPSVPPTQVVVRPSPASTLVIGLLARGIPGISRQRHQPAGPGAVRRNGVTAADRPPGLRGGRGAVLLDAAGRVAGTPGRTHRGFWTRADTRALLGAAGVSVAWDHRISRPEDLEAAYPGAGAWTDRHPVLTVLVSVVLCVAVILAIAWLFEF